jgi:hypothetical protein
MAILQAAETQQRTEEEAAGTAAVAIATEGAAAEQPEDREARVMQACLPPPAPGASGCGMQLQRV